MASKKASKTLFVSFNSHSGLHFNLALVEAALYRDGLDRLLVQPRVLARTEILQRIVIEGSIDEGPLGEEDSAQEEALSDQEEENLRFWAAVLKDYAFSDVTVEVPSPSQGFNHLRESERLPDGMVGPYGLGVTWIVRNRSWAAI